jgi:hypothetical protein
VVDSGASLARAAGQIGLGRFKQWVGQQTSQQFGIEELSDDQQSVRTDSSVGLPRSPSIPTVGATLVWHIWGSCKQIRHIQIPTEFAPAQLMPLLGMHQFELAEFGRTSSRSTTGLG